LEGEGKEPRKTKNGPAKNKREAETRRADGKGRVGARGSKIPTDRGDIKREWDHLHPHRQKTGNSGGEGLRIFITHSRAAGSRGKRTIGDRSTYHRRSKPYKKNETRIRREEGETSVNYHHGQPWRAGEGKK